MSMLRAISRCSRLPLPPFHVLCLCLNILLFEDAPGQVFAGQERSQRPPDIGGTWSSEWGLVMLTQSGNRIRGFWTSADGKRNEITDGSMDGTALTFEYSWGSEHGRAVFSWSSSGRWEGNFRHQNGHRGGWNLSPAAPALAKHQTPAVPGGGITPGLVGKPPVDLPPADSPKAARKAEPAGPVKEAPPAISPAVDKRSPPPSVPTAAPAPGTKSPARKETQPKLFPELERLLDQMGESGRESALKNLPVTKPAPPRENAKPPG
jgi:hypothetical protein